MTSYSVYYMDSSFAHRIVLCFIWKPLLHMELNCAIKFETAILFPRTNRCWFISPRKRRFLHLNIAYPKYMYPVRPHDYPWEMERNEAAAMQSQVRPSTQLLLSILQFPLGHSVTHPGSSCPARVPAWWSHCAAVWRPSVPFTNRRNHVKLKDLLARNYFLYLSWKPLMNRTWWV